MSLPLQSISSACSSSSSSIRSSKAGSRIRIISRGMNESLTGRSFFAPCLRSVPFAAQLRSDVEVPLLLEVSGWNLPSAERRMGETLFVG